MADYHYAPAGHESKKLIPVEMTREQYASLGGAENYPFEIIKIGARITTGILVPADDELYREYTRSVWNEEKNTERRRRCMVRSTKTGRLVRCKGRCEKCDRMKDGRPLSTDELKEKNEFELPDKSQSIQDIEMQVLFEQLLALLEKQAPELAHIFAEMYNGVGQREIERELAIAHGTMTGMVKDMREILQQSVTRGDIIG